ncbi:hypothetical protein [Nocardioides lentus]|uniref:hypothetical protein n=1 Tax=Nocardioides lentus TaxID=338077 RepID=UPI0031D83E6D
MTDSRERLEHALAEVIRSGATEQRLLDAEQADRASSSVAAFAEVLAGAFERLDADAARRLAGN